jgi:ATP-dependent DNA helicase RecG
MEENEMIEFKKSVSELKEGIISIVSILNKHGKGKLIMGVDGKGKSTNQQINESTLRNISQSISNHIEPKIYPKIIKEKDCVKISFEGQEKPYFAFGRAYIRTADEDKKISAKELENMFLRKEHTKWDSKKSSINIKDIDETLLKNYLKKANQTRRINFDYTTKKQILTKLDLLTKNNITNACEILFSSKKPIETQLAVFAGDTKTTFLDIQQFKGNIFESIEKSENYIKEHINWRADLSSSKRIEIPEIPLRAIKEAIVNSYCHKDYVAPESNKIAIYKNKIEIWNSGNFPEGYEPKDFIEKENPSILRNPLIANTLYLSEDIEKWGSGLKRIYEECKRQKITVEFKKMNYGFSIIFQRPQVDANVDANVDAKPIQRQKWIIAHLKKHGRIKSRLIQKQFKISKEIASRDLKKLGQQIKKQGSGNNIWYELK